MERFRVTGGARLAGEVRVDGAKNSVLKLMAAALLAEGRTTLTNVPEILDIDFMSALLRRLGCEVEQRPGTVVIDVPAELSHEAPYELVRRLRASICVLGPLVARLGRAKVALPGGDNIGSRALDMHIGGLAKLGATSESEHGYILTEAPKGLTGASVWLDFPSVGATENILMAAVLANGTTVIDNAAREPEIVDLADMLIQMGAKVSGAGTSTIEIEGVPAGSLSPTSHRTVPDRIVAGTWAVAAAMTRGDVTILNANPHHLELPLDKLVTAGADVEWLPDGFRVEMNRRPEAVDIMTLPYPGFPTDLQPAYIALNTVAEGAAMVTENIFEARFMFIDEMVRLGAEIKTDGHHAVIRGRPHLSGAPVRSHDIRAGAGLVLAGLVAEGETIVTDVHHIDRGYADFVAQLNSLGAEVVREPDPDHFSE
ncbi:UDP-N-acetylglucosamine 1-carboxyvinyltransferase [Sporichthya polymorpha]|uniref:UDP-N-acetylglucosamine 1-carboxyvinyltransferase n=1 Tax=Sporichthya polymorpha TaxID=35751 RepID=UPI0003649F28|nr:UDP-N-acetylglucosamine 1-carboxyvinyltransferase [Sporichthya polymorpha]